METENGQRSLRYELKMETEGTRHAQVQSWVRLHSAGFRSAYPSRRVNNLYFDTFDLSSFNDHIEGVPERRKLRFRWYGPDLETAQGQLELKSKKERVGWKTVHPVAPVLDLRSCRWPALKQILTRDTIARDQSGLFTELLQVSNPLVINCYQRDYYVSADGNIRLTLDYQMRAYDQRLSSTPNLLFQLPLINLTLIEFKCEVQHAPQMSNVLAEFPLRVHRHSKFVTALEFDAGALK